MSHQQHESEHEKRVADCIILTCSDTRTPDSDSSGTLIRERLQAGGHRVLDHRIVREEHSIVRAAVISAAQQAQVLLITGGTGLSSRDITPDVVAPLADRLVPGFGELFRMLSYQEIGPAAMLSRAEAWTINTCVVFAMPGSTAAVRLAMDQLIIPQLRHLTGLMRAAIRTEGPRSG